MGFIYRGIQPYQAKGSPLAKYILDTHHFREFISIKMKLDNLDELINLIKHVYNMHSNLELIMQDTNIICKILLTMFQKSIQTWYHNLDLGSNLGFKDLCVKLIICFNTSIPTKKILIKLFPITYEVNKSTKANLSRFNEKMLRQRTCYNKLPQRL